MEVLPADGSDGSVIGVHEAVLLLNTAHVPNETEWEVGLNSGVIFQEGNGLSRERGDVTPVVSAREVLFLLENLSQMLQKFVFKMLLTVQANSVSQSL